MISLFLVSNIQVIKFQLSILKVIELLNLLELAYFFYKMPVFLLTLRESDGNSNGECPTK